MDRPSPSHIAADRLTAYVLGKLAWADMEQVENHLQSCATCRGQAASLDGSGDSFVAELGHINRDAREGGNPELDRLLDLAKSFTASTLDIVAPSADDVEPIRKILAGHEVLRELARGGLGVVHLVRHPVLDNLRALKRPWLKDSRDLAIMNARFRREVKAVGSLKHDHIVQAYDAGIDDDDPYLIMEYLEGAPLSQLTTNRQLSIGEACELVRQAALGLQAAHEAGLVHRDIKPSNLMLARVNAGTARVVIIDWGLVKGGADKENALADTLTPSNAALGTFDYMAPEQARDAKSVDIRADVYSLGVTLYFLLAGQPPFQGRANVEKLLAHQQEEFPPLQKQRSDVPGRFLEVFQRMTARERANRYGSPGEVAAALQPFCCAPTRLVKLLNGGPTPAPKPKKASMRWLGWAVAAAAAVLLATVMASFIFRARPAGDGGPSKATAAVLGDGPARPVAMKGHDGLCLFMAFTPDGRFAFSECGGGYFCKWDLLKQELLEKHDHGLKKSFENEAGMLAVSPDGRFLAASGLVAGFTNSMLMVSLFEQKSVKLIDAKPFSFLYPAIAFSQDGSKLAVMDYVGKGVVGFMPFVPGAGGKVHIIDTSTRNLRSFPTTTPARGFAFSPDGKLLVGCSNEKNFQVWNVERYVAEKEVVGHDHGADDVAFADDGNEFFSASRADDTLRASKVEKDKEYPLKLTEQKRIPINKAAGKMTCCRFWPKGRALTGHADGKVVLWDLHKGKDIYQYQHANAKVTAVAISPDGHHALAATSNRLVYLHRLPAP